MAPRRETGTSRAQGKCPVEPSQPEQTEACRKARFDTALFSSKEDYQRYKQKFTQRKSSQLWCGLYYRATYGLRGPVLSTVRGVEIRLSPESIYRILDIPSVGLRVYEAKGMGKPSAHNLTVTSQVFHHMICSILLPHGGHRDEVSYLEAFIVDSILTERRIHVGYLMMMHMISCVESSTRVLPYSCFLTRSFKDIGVDLNRETDFEAPTTYDTYDEQSLGHMKFEKAPDGSWISSLGTRMEELALVHDSSFYSMEEHLDQYQTGVTSQFDHFQQRFERIEEHMDQQQATFDHLE
uniref:Putative plant transposon protein domain-containing protein n=1 Tax=Vitis vinifera TaxID=29760 RepID=A5BC80_VITVI|nr:hypothetical protein VITISV_006679 [Vitis vinifera]